MNYAWNIGASGVLTAMFRQDVAANNLANLETTAFKPDSSFTIPRRAARQEDHLSLPSNSLLERLGAGVLLAPNQTEYTQGALTRTGNPLDLAIEGDGFLTVGGRANEVRLTRDGRLTLNASGTLVTSAGARPVLDTSGRPITLDRQTDVSIDGDGSIHQNGQSVAKLAFVDVPDRRILRKQGDGLYALSASAAKSNIPATGQIVQGAVERSAVDPIKAMMAVQDAATDVNASLRLMQMQDDIMNRAINTFGRVTA